MYYVREKSTGRIVYMSRFGVRARQFLNKLRPGLSFFVDSDRATKEHIQALQTAYAVRRSK